MAALFQHPSILELLRSFGKKKPASGKTPPKPTPVPDITPAAGRMQGTLLTSQPTSPRKTMLGS